MANENGLTEPIQSERDDQEASLRSYEVLTYPADFTLEVLVDKWNKDEITIAPGQRKFVWSQAKASKLIESFLIGLPVPPLFFYQEKEDNNFLVVDGQQRLKSIVYFVSGIFGEKEDDPVFKLTGLNEKSPYFDETYKSLEKTDEE